MKLPVRSHPPERNQNDPLVLRNVQHLRPLEMVNPTLVFDAVVPFMPIVVTAQQQTTFVVGLENSDSSNKLAGLLMQGWSPVLLRILIVTLRPLTTSHNVCQVSSAAKGIFADVVLGPPAFSPCPKRLRFQVDSGCFCNIVHVTGLNMLSPVQVDPKKSKVTIFNVDNS